MKRNIEDRIILEDTVRQLRLRQKITHLVVRKDAYLTPGALDYIKDNRMTLTVEGSETVNTDIRPPKEKNAKGFVTLDGQPLDSKPEYMTHLYGNVLVPKNHPRIVFRGKLDSLEAAIIALQTQWDGEAVEGLEEVLRFCRTMLSCEVTGKPLPQVDLLGLTAEELREQSHHPHIHFQRGHILPGRHLGRLGAGLNQLRAQSREVELAAVDAFCTADGDIQRVDILTGLNRLSSALYILLFRHTSEEERGT